MTHLRYTGQSVAASTSEPQATMESRSKHPTPPCRRRVRSSPAVYSTPLSKAHLPSHYHSHRPPLRNHYLGDLSRALASCVVQTYASVLPWSVGLLLSTSANGLNAAAFHCFDTDSRFSAVPRPLRYGQCNYDALSASAEVSNIGDVA